MPEKTVTRSFRISEAAFAALEEEAKKHSISLNTLVNQLFMSYANFERFFQRLGMVKISKVAFRKMLKSLPDRDIVETGTEVAENAAKIIILAKFGTVTLTSILDYLKNISEYGYIAEYNEVLSPEGRRVITLIHGYGEKGSTFLKAFVKALFAQIDIEPRLTSTQNSITIEV